MSVVEHVEAINRAREALDWLEKHPSTSHTQLSQARDLVNKVHHLSNSDQYWATIFDLQDMVCGIYGGRPD